MKPNRQAATVIIAFVVIIILNCILTYASYSSISTATTEELERLAYIDRDTADRIRACVEHNNIQSINAMAGKINLEPEQWRTLKKNYR